MKKKEAEELCKKYGMAYYEYRAKTNENIKIMFYSSIAGLSTFGTNDEAEKEGLIKELLEENGGEEFQEGNGKQILV